jgi:Tfp pilus assembly protein PilF
MIYPSKNTKKQIVKLLQSITVAVLFSACGSSSDDYLQKGREYLKDKKYDEAINMLNQSVDKDPANTDALNARGVAFFESGDFQSAGLDYEAAIKIKPDWYKPYFNRAIMREAMKDSLAALADYNLAVQKDANQAEVLLNRGSLLARMNMDAEAITDFTKGTTLDSSNALLWYNLGNVQYRQAKYDNASISFEKTVKLDANNQKAYFALGIIYAMAKKNDQACTYLKQASKLGNTEATKMVEVNCK